MVIIRRMPNHKLAIKLEGSTRNVQGLLLVRCALKGCEESFGVVLSIVGPCVNRTSLEFSRFHFFRNRQVIIGNAHRIIGARNLRKGLFKFNKVNAIGITFTPRSNDTDRVSRVYLAIEQSMDLIKLEARMRRPFACKLVFLFVKYLALLNILIRSF